MHMTYHQDTKCAEMVTPAYHCVGMSITGSHILAAIATPVSTPIYVHIMYVLCTHDVKCVIGSTYRQQIDPKTHTLGAGNPAEKQTFYHMQ